MPHAAAADGALIHFSDSGNGAPVLLLAGLGATGSSWGAVAERLSRWNRCIAIDNRGSGRSELGHAPISMGRMAADAIAVLDHLGLGAAHVVGNSLGGMIAQEVALGHPDRVRSLVLAATSAGALSIPSHPVLGWHLAAALCRPDRSRRPAHLAAVMHGPATLVDHPERLADQGPCQLPASPGTRAQLLACLRWSSLGRLCRISAPTLVVHGTHDRLVPAVNARLIARRIPGASLALLEGSGHFFITDAGEEAGRRMARFIAAGAAAVAASRPALAAPGRQVALVV